MLNHAPDVKVGNHGMLASFHVYLTFVVLNPKPETPTTYGHSFALEILLVFQRIREPNTHPNGPYVVEFRV